MNRSPGVIDSSNSCANDHRSSSSPAKPDTRTSTLDAAVAFTFKAADDLARDGVLDLLNIDFDNPDKAADKLLTDLQHSARKILCDTMITQRRHLSADESLTPADIQKSHPNMVFDAYIVLLSACKEVECIKMPPDWFSYFLPAKEVFPLIRTKHTEKRKSVLDKRMCWVKNLQGEERSLQME
ncbi:hypothetical protein BU23DRAFT_567800 [Bimuria novae-zelandiae CBS 107.79]|uniref:Uncharacterized protein n=1 Tax=Bimuria novae-zelandiae CBS 107.79 TaxID=1447943 RepID=A0A6A5VB20_9PLEO|nr:hypothetical protein BU23DRAFT_567800 [Bimuria novae-zelandiae CBS 107.79]